MFRWSIAALLLNFVVASTPNRVLADEMGGSKVTGTGAYELKKQPDILRVQVEVLAKARSAKDALAKLHEHRQSARAQLEALGASSATIEFSEPVVTSTLDPNEARMQAMMAQRAMMQGKKAPAKPKEAPPVVVSCMLKGEIPLAPQTPEELLVHTHGLEERIKQADLGSVKSLKQNTPQEEEMNDAQMQAMGMNGGDEQNVRGLPVISYVKKLSSEERSQAVREAFKKAERQATELASAAGLVLGQVLSLDETPVQSNEPEGPNTMEWMYARMGVRYTIPQVTDNKKTPEASGAKPAAVVYRVGLNASFELKRLRPR
jgi:uncharacterized protein YggE